MQKQKTSLTIITYYNSEKNNISYIHLYHQTEKLNKGIFKRKVRTARNKRNPVLPSLKLCPGPVQVKHSQQVFKIFEKKYIHRHSHRILLPKISELTLTMSDIVQYMFQQTVPVTRLHIFSNLTISSASISHRLQNLCHLLLHPSVPYFPISPPLPSTPPQLLLHSQSPKPQIPLTKKLIEPFSEI